MKLKRIFYIISIYVLRATICQAAVDGHEESDQCQLAPELLAEILSYQDVVNKIAAAATNGSFTGNTYRGLSKFTDTFGPRMTGSKNLENSIDYLVEQMKRHGLDNVHTEKATVPHWERGIEVAEILSPRKQRLPIIGLGSSVGTPRGGIISNVVVVESFAELYSLSVDVVRGSIVVFAPIWESYSRTVVYRRDSASAAARMGAVAALVRSITPFSIGTLHTGSQVYADGVRRIPVAAITVEDAERLLRTYKRGEAISIRIEMEDRNLGDSVSLNVVAELAGQTAVPVVVLSGHIDSWDVGVGAMDDGGGSFISWKALQLIKSLGLKRPRRTLRAILWTAEEQGIYGARAYEVQHQANEVEEFNFFFESDVGTFEPVGLDFSGNKEAECIFREIVNLMTPLNATKFATPADGGPDISRWTQRGFPGASLMNKNQRYFWFHHTDGDSMLLEDSQHLDRNTALFAAAAYVIADLSVEMPKTVVPRQ